MSASEVHLPHAHADHADHTVVNDAGVMENYDPDVKVGSYVPSKPYAWGFNQAGRDMVTSAWGTAERREAYYTPEGAADMKKSDLQLAEDAVHDATGMYHCRTSHHLILAVDS